MEVISEVVFRYEAVNITYVSIGIAESCFADKSYEAAP